MTMKFYTITYDQDPDLCAVYGNARGMTYSHLTCSGIRVGKQHDPTLSFHMAKEVAGKKVPDLIRQVVGQFLVSRRAADVLRSVVNTEVEYLPTSLLNHRKKVAANDLILVNVIGYYDCVDRKKTEGSKGSKLEECEQQAQKKKGLPRREYQDDDFPPYEYTEINRLFLHPGRTPTDANLFRIASVITALVFREDVVTALRDAKLTGATFTPVGQPIELF